MNIKKNKIIKQFYMQIISCSPIDYKRKRLTKNKFDTYLAITAPFTIKYARVVRLQAKLLQESILWVIDEIGRGKPLAGQSVCWMESSSKD